VTLDLRLAKLVAALVSITTATACEGVPYLTYSEAGGVSDAVDGDVAKDGGNDAVDAAIEAGCPGTNPPPGASVCCGSVPCNGNCADHCPDCESQCTSPGTFCCAKTNNVLCRPTGSVCN
jgi:hypothetical protein